MLRIKEGIDLKELEKFNFMYHDKKDATICYFRQMPIWKTPISILIEVFKDRTIDFQLPINCKWEKQRINLKDYIQDLIQAGLVEKI